MSTTPSLAISFIQASQNAKEVTANAAFSTLDAATQALASLPMADANVTLTQAQLAGAFVFNCTGANTAIRNLIVPGFKRFFAVMNGTTGGFGVTAKTSGGSGVTVTAAMGLTLLYCDGTNVMAASSSGGGGGGGTIAPPEVPAGTVNGTNVTFTLSHTPNPVASHNHYLNGLFQDPGNDYTLSGATITYAIAPPTGSKLKSTYQY